MKQQKEYLTLEDHKTIAVLLTDALQNYTDVYKILEKQYTKTHPIMKSLLKIILTNSNKKHDHVKSFLDDQLCNLIPEDSPDRKYAFAYYSDSVRDLIKSERIKKSEKN
jgi:hypothetical protein